MIKISKVVEEIINNDDLVLALAQRGLLNASSYAREIQAEVEESSFKGVKLGSIITAINRHVERLPKSKLIPMKEIQSLSVNTNLEGITLERTEDISARIREIYNKAKVDKNTFLTLTQGINEITIVAESSVANTFRKNLKDVRKIYDKKNLVGVSVKFDIKNLEIPSMIFVLTKRLALKNINIVEIVSTATELTFIIDMNDLQLTIDQLQNNLLNMV
ncbi:hypothetical protein KJ596_02890 [Patescibacteria group bacterium]|nr:hypothetical protein [Patescibacteria group bacterium]MBU1867986.1 hypothetical protein [Patescibacteria group bacterium]